MKNVFDMDHIFCTITDFFKLYIINEITYFISIPIFAFLFLLAEKKFDKRTITFGDLPVAFLIAAFNPLWYIVIITGLIVSIPALIGYVFYVKIWVKIKDKTIF